MHYLIISVYQYHGSRIMIINNILSAVICYLDQKYLWLRPAAFTWHRQQTSFFSCLWLSGPVLGYVVFFYYTSNLICTEWMNKGIHLDLDTWIVPGQIRKANLCRGLGNRYTPAGTEVLISAVTHNTPPPCQAAQNATTVNTRSSVAPCTAQRHTPASPECHPGVKRIGTSHRDFVLYILIYYRIPD